MADDPFTSAPPSPDAAIAALGLNRGATPTPITRDGDFTGLKVSPFSPAVVAGSNPSNVTVGQLQGSRASLAAASAIKNPDHVDSSTPPVPVGSPGTPNTDGLMNDLMASFPWINQIGLSVSFFHDLVATSASPAEIITKLRQQPQYRSRFRGLWREDGSVRMTEAQYLDQEQSYRQLLHQYGFADAAKGDVSNFFSGEVDPNELKSRLDVYQQVRDGGQATKDAFYVYAGLKPTDDDLYNAMVDPAARANLSDEYNRRVSSSSFDYTTWITRATEVGLSRVADTLGGLQQSGALSGQAVQAVLRTDPNFARQIMDVLYTGGTPGTDPGLSLQELLSAFEHASIGAAASQAGLAMPSLDRIKEIRAAGVDRARASQAYQKYGIDKGSIDAASQRLDLGGFSQGQFEQASFLGSSTDATTMSRAVARETAAGDQAGQFRFGVDNKTGKLQQQGLRSIS